MAEIRAVARLDPELAAEGVVGLIERIWPALQNVDDSSGALGKATDKVVRELIDILLAAWPAERVWRRWVERLALAVEDDGVGYLWELDERFEEIASWRSRGVGAVPAAPTDDGVPEGTRFSATFLDYVDPVLQEVVELPEVREQTLQLAQMVWNAVVLDETRGTDEWVRQVREPLAGHPSLVLIDFLVDRKRQHFGAHRWLVGHAELFERDDGVSLRVSGCRADAVGE